MKRLLLTLLWAPVFAHAQITPIFASAATSSYAPAAKRSNLHFLENKGQVTDQYHNQRPDIQFSIAAAPGLNIFIGNGAIHYQFSKVENATTSVQPGHSGFQSELPENEVLDKNEFTMYRMDVELVGADKNAQVVTEEKLDYYENYFTASTNGQSAKTCAWKKIIYKDIYPHIDWVLYMSNGSLEHEFVIKDGGNAADIKLKYGGASELKINTDGSLAARTPFGAITEHAPVCYEQSGKAVQSKFSVSNDLVTYEVSDYSGTLIIDPALTWATYYGGTAVDMALQMVKDNSGHLYAAGYTASASSIATTGAYMTAFGGNEDVFLAKFDTAGTIKWATYYGGNDYDASDGLAIDGLGYLYVTGQTKSATGIATPGAYQTTYSDSGDAFLAKFDTDGGIKWATYYGNINADGGGRVATDISGNVYFTGFSKSASGIATPGAHQTAFTGGVFPDAFIAKFTSSGARLWATYYGGTGSDAITGISIDGSGYIYFCGTTTSAMGIATPGAYDDTFNGMDDAFLAKFNGSGVIQWATYYGGGELDHGICMVMDGSGGIYMAGETRSTSGIATPGSYQPLYGGGAWDGFLAKFSNSGAMLWGTYYGGSNYDQVYAMTIAPSANGSGDGSGSVPGDIYMTGVTNSVSTIATYCPYQPSFAGGPWDAYVAEFDTSGARKWATYYGGPDDDEGTGIVAGKSKDVYLLGVTKSLSGIATPGAYQETIGGIMDGFLAKIQVPIFPVLAGVITGRDTVCIDSAIVLTNIIGSGIWSSTDTFIATIAGGMVKGKMAGVDTIIYLVTNGCDTVSTTKTIYITDDCSTGIKQVLPNTTKITVYPNPAKNELNITFAGKITSVSISDLVGQNLYSHDYNTEKVQVDVSGLTPGVYLIRINGSQVSKLVKQ